ncbi:hypothetical protein EPN95_00970 [Patescibacteria group bacterium]|nr:MAG: hypothetical protein EPN95_00970 [Patescibacteria group bacterium]
MTLYMENGIASPSGNDIDPNIAYPRWKNEGTPIAQIPTIYLQTVLPIVVALEGAGHVDAALLLSRDCDEALTHGASREAVRDVAMQRLQGIDPELHARYLVDHQS